MGIFSSNKTTFPWHDLTSLEQLNELLKSDSIFILFKHSTRCSISSFAKRNFEREFDVNSEVPCYYIDLITYKDVSNEIALKLNVYHQSPQVFLVQNNAVLYTESHESIDASLINKLTKGKNE